MVTITAKAPGTATITLTSETNPFTLTRALAKDGDARVPSKTLDYARDRRYSQGIMSKA